MANTITNKANAVRLSIGQSNLFILVYFELDSDVCSIF